MDGALGLRACDGNHTFAIKCLRSDVALVVFQTMVTWAAAIEREEFAFWYR